ncbi:hypothetical protein PMIN01_02005 [Paraphaeosphaeria minitans]|uniref:Uncharacterized protein n=1 Tax=Paraphaeosphaeria minitans TaxID=565426 RepID=A0A9P6GPC4_9PLEO|nr:hypothetical protein PMIN01_02005 [Paraphaeosphaeria minitans]
MGVKGCWTCRAGEQAGEYLGTESATGPNGQHERDGLVDYLDPQLTKPRAQGECRGYGMQLSWPREGDGKRAVVARDVDVVPRGRNLNHSPPRARFVNAGAWDVELAARLHLERERDGNWN